MMSVTQTLNEASLEKLRKDFRGRLILPDDGDYDRSRVVWNGIADRHPAIIARCTRVEDVIAAVRFGRDNDLLIAVRGGGHSVAGFSTCEGGVVIDLSGMRGVQVDPKRRIARAEGGALLEQLDDAAQKFGLACPVGVVGHTGVGGLTLGGGMGRMQRTHGFTIDNLVSVDVVTARGDLLHVSDDENADLFWGMRGAGANFGIATSFEFRLHPIGPMVTAGAVVYPAERVREVAALAREVARSAPRQMSLTIGFAKAGGEPPFAPEMAGKPIVAIGSTHFGDEREADQDLRRMRRELEPLVDTFATRTYLSVQKLFDDEMAWGKRFYMKGGFMNELSDEAAETCVEQVAAASSGDFSIGLWTQGGAISDVAEDATAFMGRGAAFWFDIEALWLEPARDAANIAWARSASAALKLFSTAGHYVNDVVESGEDVVRGIYGDAKYDRLRALKRTYDPDNVFRLNQNIRP
jgi:FAD/FMN-containing dehydrogenase